MVCSRGCQSRRLFQSESPVLLRTPTLRGRDMHKGPDAWTTLTKAFEQGSLPLGWGWSLAGAVLQTAAGPPSPAPAHSVPSQINPLNTAALHGKSQTVQGFLHCGVRLTSHMLLSSALGLTGTTMLLRTLPAVSPSSLVTVMGLFHNLCNHCHGSDSRETDTD